MLCLDFLDITPTIYQWPYKYLYPLYKSLSHIIPTISPPNHHWCLTFTTSHSTYYYLWCNIYIYKSQQHSLPGRNVPSVLLKGYYYRNWQTEVWAFVVWRYLVQISANASKPNWEGLFWFDLVSTVKLMEYIDTKSVMTYFIPFPFPLFIPNLSFVSSTSLLKLLYTKLCSLLSCNSASYLSALHSNFGPEIGYFDKILSWCSSAHPGKY
jgi:hypothetical protein